jgi:hypothetical protein
VPNQSIKPHPKLNSLFFRTPSSNPNFILPDKTYLGDPPPPGGHGQQQQQQQQKE